MTWIDEQPPDKVEAALVSMRARRDSGKDISGVFEHSGGDERYALWLGLANYRCMRTIGFRIFDLEDYLWADAFENGDSPREAVIAALENDTLWASFVTDQLGEE